MNKSKITIFGGGGYIGNSLTRMSLELGYKVRVVDNFFKGQCDALLGIATNPDFEFMYGDVTNYKDCEKAISNDTNYIVILSGLVGFPICSKKERLSYLVNVEGTKNVILARNSINENIKTFFASTGSVYGKLNEVCTEESPTNPQSAYGAHKLEAEQYVESQSNTLCFRFATCTGVSAHARINLLIPDLTYNAVVNKVINIFEPDAKRTFIHIKDFCRSILWGLRNMQLLSYNLYNCGDDKLNWSKRDVAEYLKKRTGCLVNYAEFNEDADKRDYLCSHRRINNSGFSCDYTIEDSIEDLIKVIPILKIQNQYE